MPQGKIVSIRLSEYDLADLDRHVAEVGVDRSTWMRQVIMEALGKPVPPPRPRVPGLKADEEEPAPPLPDLNFTVCLHPEEAVRHLEKLSICTQCGSRL